LASVAQPYELVIPLLEVFREKSILAAHEILYEFGQTLAVIIVVPIEIKDRKDCCTIETKACTNQTVRERPG
jgi:hypothetical protein